MKSTCGTSDQIVFIFFQNIQPEWSALTVEQPYASHMQLGEAHRPVLTVSQVPHPEFSNL